MKKLNRILSLSAAAALALSLTACSGGPSGTADTPAGGSSNTPAAGETYKVAVIKQMDHASLDEIANAITARLDAIAEENGITIEYEVTSGQGDQTVLRQLSDQAIADGVDAIIPIATTAAQVAAVSAEESKTPVIFAAISYPETVELTGMDYVTGTSDALDTNQILDMMFTQNPDIGSVGLLYSLSEPNSEVPIADAKAYLDAKGVAYTEATANTNDEVIAAASSLIADGVDAVFTPTDNIIMAAEQAEKLADRQVVVLPTRTVPMGITAMLNFDPSVNAETNTINMMAAADKVSTGLITYAARDSEYDGKRIKKGEIMALENGKIVSTSTDITKATYRLARGMCKKDSCFVTIISGCDVSDEDAEKVTEMVKAKCPNHVEVSHIRGGQPVYYYMISVE